MTRRGKEDGQKKRVRLDVGIGGSIQRLKGFRGEMCEEGSSVGGETRAEIKSEARALCEADFGRRQPEMR
jgi:hypothetical protein